ncbi:C4-dicarboxylate ABC transporter substrate-binding protein [Zobellella endophytica]|uniref:C4-dicarboxylate ABC transporter substrate-binding protein n=1 Tax=Zobellella endophytica TaxID=2116700 RepID=A0A2P7RB23_9GAMM|nr:TRAP transporter substrate-binding protein [Zobellella endophytica]PSJ47415.1 C4-dicarboxylate ABC transporter substrate-binding protein [Zobellella endophytica]
MKHTLSVLALSLAALLPLQGAAATRMDFSNEYNHSSIHAEGDSYFIDKVKELTNDEVVITLHTGGALGYKSADHFYAVADNAIQLADTLAGTLAGIDPIFSLSSLPFLVRDEDQAEQLYRLARPHYDQVFADNDQILLYASPWPASGIWAKQEVASAAGLKNLKIRTYDKNGTLTLKEAGATPVNLSWADVVPQLSTGGISAVLTSAEAGANASFWEQLRHYSAIQYAIPLNMVHMNKDEFDRLTPEQQAALLEAARQTDAHNWQQVRTRVAANYRTLNEHGVTIREELPADFTQALQQAAQVAIDGWLKETGERGRQLLEQFRQEG